MNYIFDPQLSENTICPASGGGCNFTCSCYGIHNECSAGSYSSGCNCNTGYCSGCQVPIGGGGISRIPVNSL